MTYKIQILPMAQRDFKKLGHNKEVIKALRDAIRNLAANPRPEGCKNLLGNIYRIRIKKYRIIYQVEDKVLTIIILHLGPRKDIYRVLNQLFQKYLR